MNAASNYHVREAERAVAVILGRIGFVYPSMQIALPITVAIFETCLRDVCAFLQRLERVLGAARANRCVACGGTVGGGVCVC